MKIACLDKTSLDRTELIKKIQLAFASCQEVIGHLSAPVVYGISCEQVRSAETPDIFVLGPSLGVDRTFVVAKEILACFEQSTVVCLLDEQSYALTNLTRLSSVSHHVLSVSDDSVRLVHILQSSFSKKKRSRKGKLVAIRGVKGGVGGSTITAGFSHAAEALDLSSIVLDLSFGASMSYYLGSSKSESEEYLSHLNEVCIPTVERLRQWAVDCPNGVKLLPPPVESGHFRDRWLSDSSLLDVNVSIVDLLCEIYDVVFVDIGQAEGIFPFALMNRADQLVLVSSNDAASAYHLFNLVSSMRGVIDSSNLKVLANLTLKQALTPKDIESFLEPHLEVFPQIFALESVPHDTAGALWIGTGNTFFTESSSSTKDALIRSVGHLTNRPVELTGSSFSIVSRFKELFKRKGEQKNQDQLEPPRRQLIKPDTDSSNANINEISMFTDPVEEEVLQTH